MRNVNEELSSIVAICAAVAACMIWPVIVSWSCPSRSLDWTSQEACTKASKSFIRICIWTVEAIRAGRVDRGITRARRRSVSARATATNMNPSSGTNAGVRL